MNTQKKERVINTVKKVISADLKREEQVWPPTCSFIMHQPKRPRVEK